ncbi:DUF4304 domain-containing protein [Cryobacterium sp. MDB1-18-2]|nr:DUF4304 domain-containing protein [Cryobacterium sp. MDB1-18-2]TFC40681.1 DUF4304 domain-containing protein [Cryobacterium sp. MDB1-18-1]
MDRQAGNVRTMSDRNVIQTAFDEFAKTAGCSKKSGSWYRRSSETILVLNLQKSQNGLQYYVNVALWLRALGDEESPKENKCQIRTRLTRLLPADLEKRLTELLDLDSDLDQMSRKEGLLDLLREHLLPLMEASSSLEGLRSGDGQDLIRKSLVTGPGQKLLAGGS